MEASLRPPYLLLLLFFFFFSFLSWSPAGRLSEGRAIGLPAMAGAPVDGKRTRYVSKSIPGAFRSIQAAVNSVPSGNVQWVRIHVDAGVYVEKVYIPEEKPFILLEGQGKDQTIIEWGAHAGSGGGTADSATFTVYAANFMARWISFRNTFGGTSQAVAALIGGDKAAFYECGFVGFQDTLCDMFGRHFFRGCYIEGAVDFIFGSAQSLYQGCTLHVVNNSMAGWVTAQGRAGPSDPGGYVFSGCSVEGEGKAFLGRAWRPYARVIFYRTYMSDAVVPQGWDSWSYTNNENELSFVELECSGAGSDTSKRVSWEDHKLSDAEVRRFASIDFIDGDGEEWLSKQPS